jgi:signal peptidase I
MQAAITTTRRPNAFLAFVLNCFLPPLGYVYAGSLKAVLALMALLAILFAVAWGSMLYPPGVYAVLHGSNADQVRLAAQFAIAVVFGAHAAWLTRRLEKPDMTGALRWIVGVALAALPLAIAGLVWAYGPLGVYVFSSSSMTPTFREGDIIAVRGAKGICHGLTPRVGDVVAYRKPDASAVYIHRVVAGPGSTVQMRDGRLFVDDRPVITRDLGPLDPKLAATQRLASADSRLLLETLPNGVRYPIIDLTVSGPLDSTPVYRVLPGTWFIMGDNRDNAADSRADGAVPTSLICGVADRIVWSSDPRRIGRRL